MAATEQTLWTAVLFDFDGTLGDSIDLIISSLRATAAELPGYTVDEAAIRPWIGRPLTAMLVEQGVTDHAEWMNVYRRHYRRAHDQLLRPIEGFRGCWNTSPTSARGSGWCRLRRPITSNSASTGSASVRGSMCSSALITPNGTSLTRNHSCMRPDCSTRCRRAASVWETLELIRLASAQAIGGFEIDGINGGGDLSTSFVVANVVLLGQQHLRTVYASFRGCSGR